MKSQLNIIHKNTNFRLSKRNNNNKYKLYSKSKKETKNQNNIKDYNRFKR